MAPADILYAGKEGAFAAWASGEGAFDQVFGVEIETPNLGGDGGPAVVEKVLAFAGAEPGGGALGDEHADTPLHQDKSFVLEGLVGFGDGQRIGAIFCREASDRKSVV